jgi:hypothetical protein
VGVGPSGVGGNEVRRPPFQTLTSPSVVPFQSGGRGRNGEQGVSNSPGPLQKNHLAHHAGGTRQRELGTDRLDRAVAERATMPSFYRACAAKNLGSLLRANPENMESYVGVGKIWKVMMESWRQILQESYDLIFVRVSILAIQQSPSRVLHVA